MFRITKAWPGLMLSLGIALLASGCTMPIVLEAGQPEIDLQVFPEGTAAIETATADGQVLRGVHLEASPGAPLVLHLLPGRASVTTGVEDHESFPQTLEALRKLGLSSLALDYRGVGASAGPIDAAALPVDARAMWQAALARVNADPSRIIIRAASLGTLPACTLLAEGIEPAGLIIAAPIDADTITTRALDFATGPILGSLLDLFFLEPDAPYLTETLSKTSTPSLILLPSTNPFFPTQEAEATAAALAPNPNIRLARSPRDYMDLLLRFYGHDQQSSVTDLTPPLLPPEQHFLRRLGARSAAPNP